MFDAISVEMQNIGHALHRKFSLRFTDAPSCFPVILQKGTTYKTSCLLQLFQSKKSSKEY